MARTYQVPVARVEELIGPGLRAPAGSDTGPRRRIRARGRRGHASWRSFDDIRCRPTTEAAGAGGPAQLRRVGGRGRRRRARPKRYRAPAWAITCWPSTATGGSGPPGPVSRLVAEALAASPSPTSSSSATAGRATSRRPAQYAGWIGAMAGRRPDVDRIAELRPGLPAAARSACTGRASPGATRTSAGRPSRLGGPTAAAGVGSPGRSTPTRAAGRHARGREPAADDRSRQRGRAPPPTSCPPEVVGRLPRARPALGPRRRRGRRGARRRPRAVRPGGRLLGHDAARKPATVSFGLGDAGRATRSSRPCGPCRSGR